MKHSKSSLILLGFLAIGATACEQGDERLQEKARIEGEETARRQVEAENENRLKWIAEAEEELEVRHRFYQGVSGLYEGTVRGNGTEFDIRFNISPSLPPLPISARSRTLEEVTTELNQLYLSVHVTEWTEGGLAFGCVFEHVRPDMTNGLISLFSESCQRSFRISFSDSLEEADPRTFEIPPSSRSKGIASDLRIGNTELSAFSGLLQASLGASLYRFYVKRIPLSN